MKYFILLLLNFSLIQFINAQCDNNYESEISDDYILHENLLYGSNITSVGEEKDLLLDIYEPSIPSDEARPLIIFAHGGSFYGGNKSVNEVRWFCEDLAKRGIVTASINYRLEPSLLSLLSKEKMIKAVIRATEDVKAAIRYFHKSAEEENPYNINADYITAGGTSAGSIAVLHAVFMDKYYSITNDYQNWILELSADTTMEGHSGNPGYSNKVSGVVNISGALVSTRYLNDNADIPILNIHNQWDFTIPFGLGHPYQLPFLPNIMGSSHLHNQMTNIGGYSKLYVIPEINHVPHTQSDGSKHVEVYNKSMDKIVDLVRYVEGCNEISTAQYDEVQEDFDIFPNPAKESVSIIGLKQMEAYDIELLDLNGQKIYIGVNPANNIIAFPEISTGIYLLRGVNSKMNTAFTRKLMIE